jgi:hypothetical protein
MMMRQLPVCILCHKHIIIMVVGLRSEVGDGRWVGQIDIYYELMRRVRGTFCALLYW